MAVMLDVKNINVYYGAIHAVKDISSHGDEGEIVTLIGANGCGKTTTLQTVSGLLHSRTGSIEFLGQPIQSVPAAKLLGQGLPQVPEGTRLLVLVQEYDAAGRAYTAADVSAQIAAAEEAGIRQYIRYNTQGSYFDLGA